MNKPVRFLHISDTHIGEHEDIELQRVKTYPYARRLVDEIKQLPFDYDFILHTGDIAAIIPKPEIYKKVESLFQEIEKPIYYATGNHDDSPHIKEYLTMGPKTDLDKQLLTYTFEVSGITFMCIDARGTDEIDPHGQISEAQFQLIENQLQSSKNEMVFFLHYPPIELDSPWVNDLLLILNGEKLHNLFASYAEKIKGVFFGHIHRTLTVTKDNVNYYSTGSTCLQFRNYPEDKEVTFIRDEMSRMNIVTVDQSQVIVKEYIFPLIQKES